MPEPLWWLLGAIVSFYFGARELHYFRSQRPRVMLEDVRQVADAQREIEAMEPGDPAMRIRGFWNWGRTKPQPKSRPEDPDFNAALEAWKSENGQV